MAQVLNAPGRGRSRGVAPAGAPAWRLAMAPNTWAEVPVAASLSTLNPADDPALNPNYPGKPEYMSASITSWNAMFSAWNGGVWMEDTQTWTNGLTGGHADNASNERFSLKLLDLEWERNSNPTGWNGAHITDDQAVLQAGSSGSTVVFASGSNAPLLWDGTRDEASSVDGFYVGRTLSVFAQSARTITAYNGTTKTATVDPPYAGDVSGRKYSVNSTPVHGLLGENSGKYADGRVRSIHNYNRIVHATLDNSLILPTIGTTSWTASYGNFQGVRIDLTTGAETFFPEPPSPLNSSAPSGSGSCYDPMRGAKGSVWWFPSGGSRFGLLDVDTLTWTGLASIGAQSSGTSLCPLPGDLLLMGNNSGQFKVYDRATNTLHTPTFSGTAAGGATLHGQAQPVYVAADNSVYWWNNPSGSTAVINKMTVPANPKTDTWTITQTTPHESNAVTPSARQGNGTFGRFFYSQLLDGFGLMNNVDGPVYFYARADL